VTLGPRIKAAREESEDGWHNVQHDKNEDYPGQCFARESDIVEVSPVASDHKTITVFSIEVQVPTVIARQIPTIAQQMKAVHQTHDAGAKKHKKKKVASESAENLQQIVVEKALDPLEVSQTKPKDSSIKQPMALVSLLVIFIIVGVLLIQKLPVRIPGLSHIMAIRNNSPASSGET
jgi:hypothetical protein